MITRFLGNFGASANNDTRPFLYYDSGSSVYVHNIKNRAEKMAVMHDCDIMAVCAQKRN